MTVLISIVLLAVAYLVGSIPFGYVIVRVARGLDVRDYGSNNVGAINVFRVGGVWLGSLTLAADIGKGFGIVLLAGALAPTQWVVVGAGFLVVVGHAYSAWLFLAEGRFSEGKSVASALGILAALACLGALPWYIPVVPVAVWVPGLLAPRLLTGRWPQISLATMAATVSVPVAVCLARAAAPEIAFSVAMAALILVRHKNNIRRLRAGTEPRLGDRVAIESQPGSCRAD